MAKDNTTMWKILTGVFAVLFVAALLNTNLFSQQASAGTTTAPTQGTAPAVKADMTVLADDVTIGPSNAKVTIIEYSDPSCPFCGAAAGGNQQVIDYLKQQDASWTAPVPGILQYANEGKVRFVFRYFPGHGAGEETMKAMLCANEQGLFWKMHDIVFANQDKDLTSKTVAEDLAKQAGADVAKIDACLASGKYDAKILNDQKLATAAGIQGTPGFYINGKEVSGAQSFSVIKSVIDADLA